MSSILVRRRDAAQATLDKFGGVPFGYGHHDCAQMIAFHLRQLGLRPKIAKAGRYSSALGAAKAMKRLGFATLAEAMDGNAFERIAPAAVVVGDIIEMQGMDRMGALTIAMGNGRILGYHEHAIGAAVMQPYETVAAWRVVAHG